MPCSFAAGVDDYLCVVNSRDIISAMEHVEEPDPPCSLEFLEMARDLMNAHNLSFPDTTSTALDLYIKMTTLLDNSM